MNPNSCKRNRILFIFLIWLNLSLVCCYEKDKSERAELPYPDLQKFHELNINKTPSQKLKAFKDYLAKLDGNQSDQTFKASLLLMKMIDYRKRDLFMDGFRAVEEFYRKQIKKMSELLITNQQRHYIVTVSRVIALEENPLSDQVFKHYMEKLKKKIPRFEWGDIWVTGFPVEERDSKKMDELLPKLIRGGIRIAMSEGDEYIAYLPYYLETIFEDKLPEDIAAYRNLISDFDSVTIAEDAGLVVKPQILVDRLLKIEDFLRRYPETPFKEDLKSIEDGYLSVLLSGMDNTRIYDWETRKLLPIFKSTYENFLISHKDSKYYRAIKEHWDKLEKNDFIVK